MGEKMTNEQKGRIGQLIIDALEAYGHVGRRNGIHRFDFIESVKTVGISERGFRRVYVSPFCAICTDNGLYIPETWGEVQGYIRYLYPHMSREGWLERKRVMEAKYAYLQMPANAGPLFHQAEAWV
jgi:hypothetical protein